MKRGDTFVATRQYRFSGMNDRVNSSLKRINRHARLADLHQAVVERLVVSDLGPPPPEAHRSADRPRI